MINILKHPDDIKVYCEEKDETDVFVEIKVMCKNPRLPKTPVYGSNNWYYAYGNSSRKDILRDADIISELTE